MSKNHNVQLVHEDTRITSAWGKLMRVVSGAFADDTVSTPSDLTSALVPDGTMKYVEDLKCTFIYDQTSTLAPNGITIIDSDFNGNWLRQDPAQDAWGKQATWYIDSDNGSDLNNGSISHPLSTYAEWQRRMPKDGPNVDTIINVVKMDTEIIHAIRAVGKGRVLIRGVLSTVLETGTVSAYSDRNINTNTPAIVSKASGDWIAFIGKIIFFPEKNSWSFIGKDNGAGGAFIIQPAFYSDDWTTYNNIIPGTAAPVPGDTYIVYELPIVRLPEESSYYGEPASGKFVTESKHECILFDKVRFRSGFVSGGYYNITTTGMIVFKNCIFGDDESGISYVSYSLIAGFKNCSFGSLNRIYDHNIHLEQGSIYSNILFIAKPGANARFGILRSLNILLSGGFLGINSYLCVFQNSSLELTGSAYIASFGGAPFVLEVREGGFVVGGGSNAALYGDVTNNVLYVYRAAKVVDLPPLANLKGVSGGNQLNIAGTASHLPNIIAAAPGPLPAPQSCVSFAELFNVATFNGTCFDYKTGAYIGA